MDEAGSVARVEKIVELAVGVGVFRDIRQRASSSEVGLELKSHL